MSMNKFVLDAAARQRLIVQPRMGVESIAGMTTGLHAVKSGVVDTYGTITVDSYTRVGDLEGAKRALLSGARLNGFPIATHDPDAVRAMLEEVRGPDFGIQLRHGSADPRTVFHAGAAVGLTATEGGPVSYNLPYSRMPLPHSVAAWDEATRFWAEHAQTTGEPTHLETFAGCMYGQMCPPDLLVALSVLEAMFFAERGVPEVSLSLAQGSSFDQDVGALIALDRLAAHHLPVGMPFHRVFYTFMGLFPQSLPGAEALIRDSAQIARLAGAERLIVKTAAEARGIPSIEDNITALNWARESADLVVEGPSTDAMIWADQIGAAADRLIRATCTLAPDIAEALIAAFAGGVLDVPFAVHPDNAGRTRSVIDPETGALGWSSVGHMPLTADRHGAHMTDAATFHDAIEYVRRTYDSAPDAPGRKEIRT